jgi:hypothetical protein
MVVAAVLVGGAESSGQTLGNWRTCTTLAGFVGGASSADGSVAAGGSVGWELTPYFTVEGTGIWMPAGRGADTFAALFGGRVSLTAPRSVVPVLSGSVGLYHAGFDSTAISMPGFYRNRMRMDPPAFQGRHSFNDFTVALGGGIDVFLRRQMALRPEVRVLLVRGDARTHAVVVGGVSLSYHFQEHPITPSR